MSKIRLSKSYIYLLPLLGLPKEVKSSVINTHCQDLNVEMSIDEKIYVMYNEVEGDLLHKETLSENKNLIHKYTTYENTVFVYEIPANFKQDYWRFKLGRYSLLSVEAQVLILAFLDKGVTKNTVHAKLCKSESHVKLMEEYLSLSKFYEERVSKLNTRIKRDIISLSDSELESKVFNNGKWLPNEILNISYCYYNEDLIELNNAILTAKYTLGEINLLM